MPTAEAFPDGEMAFTFSSIGSTNRGTMAFQMLPRVYGSFRYSYVDKLLGPNLSLYDRSFDIHFQLRDETKYWPSVALGLRDILGTGLYSGEYLVATKTFGDRLKVTGGLGWGRLATQNTVHNPLCSLNSRFCTRPPRNESTGQGGTFKSGDWFRGPAAVFGGVSWAYNDRLTLMAELSSDGYTEEVSAGVMQTKTPLNVGLSYRFGRGTQLSGYYVQGTEVGVQLSYVFNPAEPRNAAGNAKAPPAIQPVDNVALASWNLPDRAPDQPDARQVLTQRLGNQGLKMEGLSVEGSTATVWVENHRYDARAQAIGRTNRAMANTLPGGIDRFEVILTNNGVPITKVSTNRSDLAELERDLDGAWRSLARADIEDATTPVWTGTDGIYPRFNYRLGPYTAFSFFDPDNPVRGDLGIQFRTELVLRPGLTFSGQLRQPIVGNIDEATRVSNSVLPHVRSDWPLYAQQSDIEMTYLTAEYIWRPRTNLFARVTGGYLEPMFGGLSAEMLWYPAKSRLALGGEINYSVQREFDMLFDFRDYNVTTGHASAYYDFGNGFLGQVDMGRYLAGDWGATFSLDREFNNGFKVGAFFTLTDVPFDDFGEGSFDKGIVLSVPLSWFTGQPSRSSVSQVVRPILRDGGARLNVRNRLYGYTRAERGARIAQRWGKYYR